MNVHGGWGADAVDFAKRIVSLAVGLRPSLDYVDVMNDFVGRIAVAIQRGNYVAYLLNSQRVFNVAVPIAKLKGCCQFGRVAGVRWWSLQDSVSIKGILLC